MSRAPLTRRRLPPLNALRAFEAAARHQSFKEAAIELNVSQSAISHQVRTLEEHLGVALFLRKTRAVELTPGGRIYFPLLRDAFDRIAEGTALLVGPRASGTLTIQAYSSFTIRWLIQRLPRFHAAHPELRVRLYTAQDDVDFATDEVDGCILIGQPGARGVRYDYLFSCELFPVCSPAWLAANGPLTAPADLAGHTLLQVYPSEQDWWTWLDAHAVHGADPAGGLQFDSYDLALGAALAGIGVALGQQPYVARDLASGMLVELFPGQRVPNPNRWYFASLPDDTPHPGVEKFRAWLLAEVEADPDLVRRP